MGRQIVLSLALAVAVLAAAGGVVLSVSKTCLDGDCIGPRDADTLTAGNDNSRIIDGLEGNDIITGGGFNDTIDVREDPAGADGDIVDRGPGKKAKVFFDEGIDTVARCEIKNPSQ